MRFTSKFTFLIMLGLAVVLSGTSTSCMVVRKDNGKHKGWYKNPKNPHHPATTKSKPKPAQGAPVKAKGKK